MIYNWPLSTNTFSFIDRLKICAFFLNKNNFWTQNKYVKKYEEMAAKYVGSKYAVFVSSGSSANQLICQNIKDNLLKNNLWPQKNKVVLSAVSWQTNASVWVREGFEPIFIDVSLNDLCLDYDKLNEYLKNNHNNVACVFPTSLIGYTPNMERLLRICDKYDVELRFDHCESTESSYFNGAEWKNVCSVTTSSTSTYIAHVWSNGQEGGFVFTNYKHEYEYFLLSRAHGLRRNLLSYLSRTDAEKYTNPLIGSDFDFQTLSSNYRSSDIAAFCGILSFKNNPYNKQKRIKLYNLFKNTIDKQRYFLPDGWSNCQDVLFCLPIIVKRGNVEVDKIKETLNKHKIEYRGTMVSGNMLRQKPYQKFGDYRQFENAEFLHTNGMYVGLHPQTTEKQVLFLTKILNEL